MAITVLKKSTNTNLQNLQIPKSYKYFEKTVHHTRSHISEAISIREGMEIHLTVLLKHFY